MKTAIDIARNMQRTAMARAQAGGPAQLELWSEKVRALPNALTRCALFTAGNNREERAKFEEHQIVSLQNFQVTYTGQELRQDDQDVFLQIVHLARGVPLGARIEITGNAVLKVLGWGRSGEDYKRLRASLKRLKKGDLEVREQGKRGFIGSLIMTLSWEGEEDDSESGEGTSTQWTMSMDPKIIALFGQEDYTLIDWQTRLKLSPMAKWLHSFYVTHREPVPYKVATLHKLCGSRAKELKHFRATLKRAFEELKEVGFLAEYEVTVEMVTVKRRHATNMLAS
ncbi:plasmid replication initiator TrfA [Burkholderia gladioli]|uniref:plasmid replication initiator TrfA n=1 Tax=Burkholderia gladioli TaxID=28095 RepID=UPI003B505174